MVHMPVAEWGQGKHLYLAFHDGVFCHPEKGVVFPCESTNLLSRISVPQQQQQHESRVNLSVCVCVSEWQHLLT